jgi:hypothetical protein
MIAIAIGNISQAMKLNNHSKFSSKQKMLSIMTFRAEVILHIHMPLCFKKKSDHEQH